MLTILGGTKTSTARFPAALMAQAVQIIGLVPTYEAMSNWDWYQMDSVLKSLQIDFLLTRNKTRYPVNTFVTSIFLPFVDHVTKRNKTSGEEYDQVRAETHWYNKFTSGWNFTLYECVFSFLIL